MSGLLIMAGGVAIMAAPLAAVCAYGPARDRVKAWRSARRPIRIAQLTRDGWAEVMPGICPGNGV